MTYPVAVCTVKTPDDGQMNCPKHVEFYSKNKFEELVHLVGFIIRIYHDARSPERQIRLECSLMKYVYIHYERRSYLIDKQKCVCCEEKTTNCLYFLVLEGKILRVYPIILKRKYVAHYLPLFKLLI